MQRLFVSFLTVALIWIAHGRLPPCDHLGTVLYEDLGCRPYYAINTVCPKEYSCTPFTTYKETCLFRGKRYQAYEMIKDEMVTENCFYDCACVRPTGYDKYKCSVMKCPEWSRRYNITKCYNRYIADRCCAVGTICPKNGTEIYECEFEGKRYKEGEMMLPRNTCFKCACRKGFTGLVEEPFCKRTLCATQVVNYEELENYCGPLYLPPPGEIAFCCPNDWVCHSQNDTIITINPKINTLTDQPCLFGPEVVKAGDGIIREFSYFGEIMNVTCICRIPPLMTCTATSRNSFI